MSETDIRQINWADVKIGTRLAARGGVWEVVDVSTPVSPGYTPWFRIRSEASGQLATVSPKPLYEAVQAVGEITMTEAVNRVARILNALLIDQ